jgi:hypothetical protein
MRTIIAVAVLVVLVCLSCSRRPEKDWEGRSGTVTAKAFRPPTIPMGEAASVPAQWSLTVKPEQGEPVEIRADETLFHKYEVGDRYP